METKTKSAITEARIQAPTFDDVIFRPTLTNFFYGRNGSGKTTLARVIQSGQGLTWSDKELPIYLYDSEFIQRNVTSYDGMQGVFSLSEENAGIQEQLAHKTEEKMVLEQFLDQAARDVEKAQADIEDEKTQHQKTLWRMTADLRQKFPAVIPAETARSIRAFAERLAACDPRASSVEELEPCYQDAFGKERPAFDLYLDLPSRLTPAVDLMDIPIVSASDSAFTAFWKLLENLDWVRKGHSLYQHSAGDKCPYCQQSLPEDFSKQLAACYDEKYRADYTQLEDQAAAYREYASLLRDTVNQNRQNSFPGSQSAKYRHLADLLLEKLNAMDRLIDQKLSSPSEELHPVDIDPLLKEMREITDGINQRIIAIMNARADVPGEQARCADRIWRHMASVCGAEFQRHQDAANKQEHVLSQLQEKEYKIQDAIQALEDDIEALHRSANNTTEAMEAINQMLSSNGFIGFHLREKPDSLYHYELVRNTPDGTVIASGLSEGERHLIAFLYFYHQVMGSPRQDGKVEDKVVIIDDPVSSMDSSTLNTVAALTREIVAVCLDNNVRDKHPSAGHIKQLFCLTHNPVFFRAVSASCLSDYENCGFFEIRKDRHNRSSVIPCEKEIRDPRVHMVNFSPIVNDYEYLWREYFRTDDPVTLLNVCRRILSVYFLRTIGHPEADLQAQLLEQNRDAFIVRQEDGSTDRTAYHIATAMVSLMDSGGNGMIDGVYYDASACDLEQIRYVFHKIFEIMHSVQHYEYMRRNKEIA